ncbi:hypothetical protein Tco_0169357 [Tanacetum coccineum]
MTTLADKSLLSGGDNKPPMLEKHLYDSWKSRMELYMMNRPHGRMILASVEKGPLVWPTITVDGVTRPKEYTELTPAKTIQADYDIKKINIILQGLPTEIYALVSQHRVAKDIWEKIKLLMQGTSLTKEERECKLYDEFDKFFNKETEESFTRVLLEIHFSLPISYTISSWVLVKTKATDTIMMEGNRFNQFRGDKISYAAVLHELSSKEQVGVTQEKEITLAVTEITSDSNIIPYSHYLIESQQPTVQNSNSSAQQDALILSVIEQLKTQVANCIKINLENKNVNNTLIAELERYKEQVKVLNEGKNVDLRSNDNVSDLSAQFVEIDRLKQTLSEHLKEKESLMQIVSFLKDDFRKEESRNIDREISLEKRIKQLDNIVFKRDQSAQTVHMLTKPRFFYNHTTKQALGFQNPFFLKKAQQLEPKLYNSVNSVKPTLSSRPTNVEVPKELPKVSMVNTSLKKLKHHLTGFDVIVKERTTPTAIIEEKVLVITALKDDLRKLKGKALVDNDVTKHPSDPEMLKIDVEPITPKLLNK